MTPVEVLKTAEKDFHVPTGNVTTREVVEWVEKKSLVARPLRDLTVAILKAELERVEGQIEQRTAMDEECRWCSRQFCDMDGNVCVQRVTHNTALTDHANFIKSQIKLIEEL